MFTILTRWCVLVLSTATSPGYEGQGRNNPAFELFRYHLSPSQSTVTTCTVKLKLDRTYEAARD